LQLSFFRCGAMSEDLKDQLKAIYRFNASGLSNIVRLHRFERLIEDELLCVDFLDEVRQFIQRIEKGCGQMNIDYVPLTTKRDYDVALATYLARRRSLAK